jgi:hypothetical protein
VGPGAGLDGCGKSRLPPIGIRSPDRPAHSESLCRLRHPGLPVFFMKVSYSDTLTINVLTKVPQSGIIGEFYTAWSRCHRIYHCHDARSDEFCTNREIIEYGIS